VFGAVFGAFWVTFGAVFWAAPEVGETVPDDDVEFEEAPSSGDVVVALFGSLVVDVDDVDDGDECEEGLTGEPLCCADPAELPGAVLPQAAAATDNARSPAIRCVRRISALPSRPSSDW